MEPIFIIVMSAIVGLAVYYFITKAAVRNGFIEAQRRINAQTPPKTNVNIPKKEKKNEFDSLA